QRGERGKEGKRARVSHGADISGSSTATSSTPRSRTHLAHPGICLRGRMKLYRTSEAVVLEEAAGCFALPLEWDELFRAADPFRVGEAARFGAPSTSLPDDRDLLPPVEGQEVWAAGVTYYRSRDARIDESKAAGGGDFYARVYEAERPELFFKAAPF